MKDLKYRLEYSLCSKSLEVTSLFRNHPKDYGDCFSPIVIWDITLEEKQFLEEWFTEIGFKKYRFSVMYTGLYV